MNYCQFLCYGLLKIFLKEVINTNQSISDLLCSYFLKTAIFWEIITTRSTWSKKDFLARFWDCFRRLISWVENGYCPNFFIPENNMFLGKIHGRVQRRLLDHLLSLYNKGYNCIPVCNCTPCTMILANPQMFALKFIDFNIDKIDYDINLLNKFCHLLNNIGTSDFSTLLMKMSSLQHIRTQNEVAPWSNGILAFSLELELLFSSMNYIIDALHVSSNKVTYHSVCKYVTAFGRHRFDLSTNNLLSAFALYKLGMYAHASRILIKLRARLQQSLCIHSCCTDRVRYEAAGGELYPPDVMMRKAFLIPLRLMECPVSELDLEHQNLNINITYHPTVFMNFLLFLSYFRMSMFEDADSVIHDLTTFIKKENTIETFSPVSFEMLGICQEMGGYIQDAYNTYKKALNEPRYRIICQATVKRIQNLRARYGDFLIDDLDSVAS
ncbi:hypothetical protein FSP39_013978 [Pinctada imbricata]|uniref:Mab-21-like HhH/H2TH-like domain-containing protein n=1 Tax=Pinctada imbricata TaxID=66713 RepID=A0AA88YLP3_PINIB|nr:hypothetical protein FSP39_013978 [Pinctada imbricata]